jgi:hypothetical protein
VERRIVKRRSAHLSVSEVCNDVCNQCRLGNHAMSAPNYRTVMRRRWREWDIVSQAAFAGAAA